MKEKSIGMTYKLNKLARVKQLAERRRFQLEEIQKDINEVQSFQVNPIGTKLIKQIIPFFFLLPPKQFSTKVSIINLI